MAKVISLFQLRGTIDELTFRKTAEGIIAGMKPGPRRERVLTHENFRRTRRNAAEFQLAIREARLMRHALGSALNGKIGSTLNGRMNGLFYTIARTDRVSDLGCRQASAGDIGKLTGFEFNKALSLDYALPDGYEYSLDVHSGRSQVAIPSFIARKRKDFPPGATHFRIVSALVSVDFEQKNYRQDIQRSDLLPLRKKTPGAICIEHAVAVPEGAVVAQVLGMEFYDDHGKLLKGAAIQVLEVVKTSCERRASSYEPEKATRHQGNEASRGGECGIGSKSGVKSLESVKTGSEATGGNEASRECQRSEKAGPEWEVVEVERMADFEFEEEGSRMSEVGSQKKEFRIECLASGIERCGAVSTGNEEKQVQSLELGVQRRKPEVTVSSQDPDPESKLGVGLRELEFLQPVAKAEHGERRFAAGLIDGLSWLIPDEAEVEADSLSARELIEGQEMDLEAAVLSG